MTFLFLGIHHSFKSFMAFFGDQHIFWLFSRKSGDEEETQFNFLSSEIVSTFGSVVTKGTNYKFASKR